MRNLRCGTHGISVAESSLLKTLFRLYAHGRSGVSWSLVDSSPYDAMLVDEKASEFPPYPDWENVGAVLKLGNAGSAGPDTLARPIRSEQLQAWLENTARTLPQLPPQPQAQHPQQPSPGQFPVSGPVASSSQTPSPAAAAGPEATTFRLLRWPPSAMLRNDPRLIRMATVLSRRAMKVSELAQLSLQPMDEAYVFVQALRSAGMLDIRAGTISSAASPTTAPAPTTTHATRKNGRKVEPGLVSRIRLRLGL